MQRPWRWPQYPGQYRCDGRYTHTGVGPGIYRLQLCCDRHDYVSEWYDDRLIRDDADLITITGRETVEAIDLAVKRGATVSGRIRDAETGLPSSGMRVPAGLAAYPYLTFTYTDGQGQFTLRAVPDGDIVVPVDSQGYVEQRKPIAVTEGQHVVPSQYRAGDAPLVHQRL